MRSSAPLAAAFAAVSLVACYRARDRQAVPEPSIDASVRGAPSPARDGGPPLAVDASAFECADPSLPPPPPRSDPACWCAYLECSLRVRGPECHPAWLACEDASACTMRDGDPPPPPDLEESCWCRFLRCHERGDPDCSIEACGDEG